MLTKGQKLFKGFAVATLVTVFSLIIIGGIVRITGAGMGCPDWPTCFGKVIPPTTESQLPPYYHEIYKDAGYAKSDFNAVKTWTEYINRLFGVLTGLTSVGMFVCSFSWWKTNRSLVFISALVMLMIGFEGWLGAVVVHSNLAAHSVTYHLVIAMAILALSIIAILNLKLFALEKPELQSSVFIRFSVIIGFAIMLIQVIWGTLVRSEIDGISQRIDFRGEWITNATQWFPGHKFFASLVFVASGVAISSMARSLKTNPYLRISSILIFIGLLGQMITGMLLNGLNFPASAQLFHLIFSMTMFAGFSTALFYVFFFTKYAPRELEGEVNYAK